MSDNKTQIFISFKNTDFHGEKTPESFKAAELYKHLTDKMGCKVFMSNETLMAKGASNYKKDIDKALDEAFILIVLGSSEDYLESEWVRYEWDTFQGEILAGRKKGFIFNVLLDDMRIAGLPIALRKYESFQEKDLIAMFSFIESIVNQHNAKPGMLFLYSCLFTEKIDGKGYDAYFPDLDLRTDGDNLSEAFLYAENLLLTYAKYIVKYDCEIKKPTRLEELEDKFKDKQGRWMLVSALVDRKD